MNDRLAAQIDRMNADLAPCDELPLHAARTAIARGDMDYFDRWLVHEDRSGRGPLLDEVRIAWRYLTQNSIDQP